MPMLNYVDLLGSQPFKLILGRDRKSIFVPSVMAKEFSVPLHELMTGDTETASNGCATLEHVEPETFGAFWSFVNSGEYNPLSLDEGLDHLHSRGARRQDTEDSDYGGIGQVGLTRTLTGRLAAPEDDTPEDGMDVEAELEMNMEIETQLEPSAAVMVEKWDFGLLRQQKKQDWKDDFRGLVDGLSPVVGTEPYRTWHRHSKVNYLLFHAKVYVFADGYRIKHLTDLCLRKLHSDLCAFDITLETRGHILELLQFTYQSTSRRVDREDELRMLVIQYVSCVTKKLTMHVNFRDLLDKNSEMASDLVHKLL